jgi:hypothetical protein
MMKRIALLIALLFAGCDGHPDPVPTPVSVARSPRAQLPIIGLFQETAEWCWAAVGEMVLRFYGEPNVNPFGNYQCGLVGAAGAIGVLPPVCQSNCTLCILPIGSPAQFVTFLQSYPGVAQSVTGVRTRPLSVTRQIGALSYADIQGMIDSSTPIIAGITPNNIPSPLGPAHATLIIGYDTTVPGGRGLIVNDPFPYGLGPFGPYGDPYLQRGARYVSQAQYLIDYAAFSAGLAWTDTIIAR